MQVLINTLPYIQITISVLLIIVVLIQQSDASLGSSFGADDSGTIGHTRRGIEKFFFNSTIILGILFAVTAFIALLIQ